MFSFSNGILRIGKEKPGLDFFIDTGFFLLLCSQFATPSVGEGVNYFYYFAFFLFVGLTVVKLMLLFKSKGSFIVPSFTLWFGGFTLLSFASSLWADYPANCMLVMSKMLQSTVITFCMAQNYATRTGLLKCVRMFSWGGVYALAFIMIKTPFDTWFSGGFGFTATALNPNTIGMIFTICVLVSFYFAFYCKEKKYYIFTLLQMFMVILTGSRKSLISSVVGLTVMILMKSQRRNLIFRIIMVLVFVIVLFYLIMSVPELYAAIGVRIESMLNHVFSDGGDYSMSLRQSFIEHAKDMFFEKPLFGYGINNFIVKIGQRIGVSTYAHNNYYEILADLGIVGFVAFYGYYFYLAISLLKIWRKSSGSLVKLMLVWVAVIMVCEYGLVSYYQVYIHMTLCCAYLFICAYNNEDDFRETTPSYFKYKNGVYE